MKGKFSMLIRVNIVCYAGK